MRLTDNIHDVPIDNDSDATPQASEQAPTISFSAADTPKAPDTQARRRRRGCGFWTWFVLVIVVALGVTFWLRYLNPYVTDAVARGYIERVEKRGIIFKTYEGEMIRRSALDDTTSVYSRDFAFSIESDSLAQRLQSFAGTGTVVSVRYRSYYGSLPWRGASRNVVESVTVDY